MDCDALAWYEQQHEGLQTRIRMLARFTADLQDADWRCFLPGASRGARDDRVMFDQIVDQLIAPLLSKRMQGAVRNSWDDGRFAAPTVEASELGGRND